MMTEAGAPPRAEWSRLAALLARTGAPESDLVPLLQEICAEARHALDWAYVAISLGEGRTTEVVAEADGAGALAAGAEVRIPLVLRGEPIGALTAGGSPPEHRSAEEAARVLEGFAQEAAVAVGIHRLLQEQERTAERLDRSREQLLAGAELAALGRLTAVIVHEINSPLGGVLNAFQLARYHAEEYRDSIGDRDITAEDHRAIATELLEVLDLGEAATQRVAQAVRGIRDQAQAGGGRADPRFPPAEVIERTVQFVQKQLRDQEVTLHVEAPAEIRLAGDPRKLALVLQNLVTNAIDAYRGGAAEVWIRLEQRGPSVCLEVEDRGCGIPEAVRPHVFDALFTTKEAGSGSGAGLWIVQRVVSSHFGGKVELSSEPGSGTTVRVCVPFVPAS